MDTKFKDLLRKLLDSDNVRVVSASSLEEGDDASESECSVGADVEELKEAIAEIPDASSDSEAIVKFGLHFFSDFVKTVAKEGNIKALEVQLVVARKPDDVDLDDPEFEHERLHLDHKRLLAQRMTKEAEVLSRFLTIVRGAFASSKEDSDA